MVEQTANPEATTPEPAQPEPDKSTPAAVEPTAPQAQDNALAAQLRKEKKAREKAEAELAKRAEADKTEEEKKLDAAYKKGKSEADAQVLKVKIEGKVEAAMARHGIPQNLLPSVISDLGEIDDPAEVPKLVDDLVKSNEAVYGVYAAGAKPQPVKGAPSHATNDGEFPRGGRWDRAQLQEVISRGLYSKYKESIEAGQAKGDFRV